MGERDGTHLGRAQPNGYEDSDLMLMTTPPQCVHDTAITSPTR